MHNEGKVCFALGCENTSRSKTGVVNKKRVIVAHPLDGIRRIGDNEFKGFVIPMSRVQKCVLAGNVKLIKADIVQEHIDTAQVVSSDIDFLTVETLANSILTENTLCFQKQRTRTAGRVINLINLGLADCTNSGEQFGHIGRCEKFAARLTSIGCIHSHKVLVSIAKGINGIVLVFQFHIGDAVQNLNKALVSLGNGSTEFIAVYIKVRKQTSKIVFAFATLGTIFNIGKDLFQCFVQVLVGCCFCSNVAEQFARKDEETFFLNQTCSCFLGIGIRHLYIIKIGIACFNFTSIDVGGNILGNIAVEHSTKNIVLEVPSVNSTTKVVGNRPYSAVKFCSFLLFSIINHCSSLLLKIVY